MNTKKNIFLWALYDFANSIVSIVFFLYIAQLLVVDMNMPDMYYNLAFTVSALLLLCTAPLFGMYLDTRIRRITGLRYTTGITVCLYMLCSYFAIQGNGFGTLVTFTLGLYTYLLSFTSYSPLISDISSDTNRGFVSGLGIASNYVGQFVGLLIALPFSNGTMSLFGSNPRAETLLPSVIAFCVLALPMLIWFKEPKIQNQLSVGDNEVQDNSNSSIISSLIRDTSIIYKLPGVALFLLSYFLFNDAVLTASNNFPIFLESVWGVSDTVKTYILLGILVTSALGGLISGKIADKIGHKRTLMWITGGWIVILPLVGLSTQFSVFVSMTVIMGFWFGSNWAVSRSVMSYLAPARYTNLTFAYYGLVERASSFVGPIIWGLTIYHFEYAGVTKYRYATLAITCFILLGFIVLSKVRSDR